MACEEALKFERLAHHEVEITVVIDGHAEAAVVVHKLLKSHLEQIKTIYIDNQ